MTSMTATAPAVKAVVVDIDANDTLDITTTEQLEKLTDSLSSARVALGLAHVHGPALDMIERSGLVAKIGPDHLFPTTRDAVTWATSHAP